MEIFLCNRQKFVHKPSLSSYYEWPRTCWVNLYFWNRFCLLSIHSTGMFVHRIFITYVSTRPIHHLWMDVGNTSHVSASLSTLHTLLPSSSHIVSDMLRIVPVPYYEFRLGLEDFVKRHPLILSIELVSRRAYTGYLLLLLKLV